jgi:hypothetical protein
MPTIIFSPTAQLQQVDDFPKDCERSVTGAIHIRPGSTVVVTDGEAAHLKTKGIVFSVVGRARAAAPSATPSATLPPTAPLKPLPGPSATPSGSVPLTGSQSGSGEK